MNKIFLTIVLTMSLYAELIDGVAIVVKGSAITLYDIKKEMQFSKNDAKRAADILIRKKLEELEKVERKLSVTSSEVYDNIKQTASRNNMSVNDLYDAIRNSNGLSSTEFKEKTKEKLLSQKLYSSIAYSSVSQPDDVDIEEYYKLHKKDFTHASSFDVSVYVSKDKARLQEKIDNPMFYSPDIQTNDQTLAYGRISPELANLLENTSLNSFTEIVPDGQGAFMSFYLKSMEFTKEGDFNTYKDQIVSKIMAEQREQVLGEYFTRLKLNADINHIRMPK